MNYSQRLLGLLMLGLSAVAWAALSYNDYLTALCFRESGCNPTSQNQYGFIGRYQMGESALIDAGYYQEDRTPDTNDWQGTWTGKNGITRLSDFLTNTDLQTQAINDYNAKQWGYITSYHADQYVGQIINGILITESGLLAGAHLVGAGGLFDFLSSGGQQVPKDANKTAVTDYISQFSGYDIAPISGHVSAEVTVNTDQSVVRTPNAFSTITPDTAFKQGSGLATDAIKLAAQSVMAALLLLWTAYVTWGQYKKWSDDTSSLLHMTNHISQATVMMLFLLLLVLT